jgi:hypothetical protein
MLMEKAAQLQKELNANAITGRDRLEFAKIHTIENGPHLQEHKVLHAASSIRVKINANQVYQSSSTSVSLGFKDVSLAIQDSSQSASESLLGIIMGGSFFVVQTYCPFCPMSNDRSNEMILQGFLNGDVENPHICAVPFSQSSFYSAMQRVVERPN